MWLQEWNLIRPLRQRHLPTILPLAVLTLIIYIYKIRFHSLSHIWLVNKCVGNQSKKLIIERIRVRIKIRVMVRVRHYLWLAVCVWFIVSLQGNQNKLMCGLEVELQSTSRPFGYGTSQSSFGRPHTQKHTHTHTHTHTYIFIYNILEFVRWWSSFPSIRPVIRPVIHPSKFFIPEEEDDGRGGGGKTPVVLPITLIKWGCPYTENRRMNVSKSCKVPLVPWPIWH
jgi:hypothetical protein